MSDLIDRQAAIEAAKDWYDSFIAGSLNGLLKRIEALPSAQPEIIRCKDCKHYELASNGCNGDCKRQYATFYPWDFCSYGERKENDY